MIKLVLKHVLALFFVLAGVNHFVDLKFYLKIMPPYIPWHLFWVYLTGILEMVLGVLLFVPKFNRVAGFGMIALLILIFPANIHMALHPELYPDISPIALWVRLPLQGVLILWAYWCTRPESTLGARASCPQ